MATTARLASALQAEDELNLENRSITTISAFAELARFTSGHPGRKNLLWLSEDFPLSVTAQLQYNDLSRIDQFELGDLPGSLDAANQIANAQIAVYPINVAGLQTDLIGSQSRGNAETSPGGPQLNATLTSDFGDRQELFSIMNQLAWQTGGKAFENTNDLSGALERSVEDGSSYYTLAYRPSNHDWNRKFRKIRVDLASKGYSLDYRRGYFALPEDTPQSAPAAELAAALEPDVLEAAMLRISSRLLPPGPASGLVQLDSTLDITNVGFAQDQGGGRHAKVLVSLIAYRDAGKAAPVRQTSTALNLDLSPEQYKTYSQSGVQFRQQLPLTPGKYRLRLGVADLSNHRLGTLDIPVVVGSGSTAAR